MSFAEGWLENNVPWGRPNYTVQMKDGSIVSLLCDGGDRYLHTYYDDAWVERLKRPEIRALTSWAEASTTS